ncbi:MAG: AAA family ATPase [Myxococcales bacterium]|nr:AAA family ATPase [Myxococcales bacterium]
MSDDALTPDELALIEDEAGELRRIQNELAHAVTRGGGRADYDREIVALRDQMLEERAEDHAMLVETMTRLAALRAAQDRESELPADPRSPYFAHLRLRDVKDGAPRTREVFIGRRAFIDTQRDVQIVDWRNSPISRIYYCYRGGDEYEERFANELQTGTVAARRTLNITDGHLARVQEGDTVLVHHAETGWRRLAADRARLAGGVGTAVRAPSERLGRRGPDGRLPEITALIDPEQFRIISGDRSGVVIIRGGAGTGKTTIALHRVAFLHFHDRQRFAGNRILVITPGDALRRYVERVLPALDVANVPIRTFPAWAFDTVKRLVPGLKKRRLTDETPMGARRLKRHPALLAMLEEALRDEAREWDDLFEGAGGKPLLDAWVKRRNLPTMRRVMALRRWLDAEGKDVLGPRIVPARKLVRQALDALGDPVETWAMFLTDRRRLAEGFGKAGVEYYEWELDQLVDTVSQQADEPADLSDFDASHRTGVDGASIDEDSLRATFDSDDLALILRVCQLKYDRLTGPSKQVVEFEHVVVDEAQDLSPMILKVLCGAVKRGGPVTLAGDTAQRLWLDTGFDDWDALVKILGVKAHVLPPLAVSYRSTRQVMSLAHHVLGPLAPDEAARDARDGAPVELMRFEEAGEAVAFLGDALKSLRDRERRATVALVARTPAVADLYYEGLRRSEVPELRRVRRQEFSFTPGVDVTDVFQIKGLEYDYIVLLEPTAEHYPDAVDARHLLHVAMTRAAHQLWMVCSGRPSPLLPDALLRGEPWPPIDPDAEGDAE